MNIIGCIDAFDGQRVIGWAYDQSAPVVPLVLQMYVGHAFAAIVPCNLRRPDVASVASTTDTVGFDVEVPNKFQHGSEHVVELFALDGSRVSLINPATGLLQTKWPLSQRHGTTKPLDAYIIGIIDDVHDGILRGWAYDPTEPLNCLTLELVVDGRLAGTVVCNVQRDDLAAANHPMLRAGFYHSIPSCFFDNQLHELELRSPDGRALRFVSTGQEPGWRRSFTLPSATYMGQIDGLFDGTIRGWVVRHDHGTGARAGGLQVLVMMQNQPVAQIKAGQFRPDVSEVHSSDPNCGFVFTPQPRLVAGRTIEFRFQVIPGGVELAGSPYRASFASLGTVAVIRDLQEATDKIFTDLWALRDRLRKLTPEEAFTVDSFDPWARRYYAAQAGAPNQLEEFAPDMLPLISVICPVYRPQIPDFESAVRSVMAQSYKNWELLIVDDCSEAPQLASIIKEFARNDARIRAVFLKKNGGISCATNIALTKAHGKFVAFFDHDDLLVPRALEFMLAAALRTGARLLYCDEDKIDDQGFYSEVNFKPDWNYRLLLAQNYVCHLLFVERADVVKAGPLRAECDGAQDHDLVIRLSEIIPHDQIHHVPEVLYHWRKTPTSTATSGKSKAYAVAAGARAIQDHLERRGLVGRVHSPREITCYEIDWTLARHPTVTILIPYREHVDMTRECVEALLSRTDYPSFDVILIDNWSTSDEALAFSSEMAALDRVEVLRVEEQFNYSRLNNLAAGKTISEFLLFMNNDIVLHQRDWLEVMIGEMLADDRVGIVGNKLLYPNGTVQHAGVILGVGGIADHAHRGISADAPGYMARAISAQDLSAVTAACLLCRRSAFEQVGGFDEAELAVAFNDVDLCLKIREVGWRVIWTPQCIAEHRESLSRGSDLQPTERSRFFEENEVMSIRWAGKLRMDPFYSPNFSREWGIFYAMSVDKFHDFRASASG